MLEELLWDQCLSRLRGVIRSQDLDQWIRPLRAVVSGDRLALYAPNRLVLERVRGSFLPAIQETANSCSELPVSVSLSVGDGPLVSTADADAIDPETPNFRRGKLDPRFTLENFIEGKSNAQAKAACLHVAARTGQLYNPLLIYGGPGLGKTHLMHGVGNSILKRSPRAKVTYLLAEQWYNQFVAAIRFGRMVEFKEFYRSVDALLIDDIHFFAAKQQTQEEFFHTFNALIDGHKQIVLTCDRYPRELDSIDERLRSRFTGGLSVAVEPPELETRVAILLSKASVLGLKLSEEVATIIAQRLRSNVRELEGALHRLTASASLTGQVITAEWVRQSLRDMFSVYDRSISLESIKKSVAGFYNIRIGDLNSARRTRTIARPRQMAMALAKELTQHSYPEIGEAFGKDHTTVIHAHRKIADLRAKDERIRDDYEKLLRLLSN